MKHFTKVILFVLLFSLLIPTFAACNEKKEEGKDTSADVTTKEDVTTEPLVEKDFAGRIPANWSFGYVASHTHKSTPDMLVVSGNDYSYSDVILVPNAGTVITFTDDNTNSNGDANFASASAAVVSHWKQNVDEWDLDTSKPNIAGNSANSINKDGLVATYADNKIVYVYTTREDNECIRLCYRSGQTASFTPAAFPEITYTYHGYVEPVFGIHRYPAFDLEKPTSDTIVEVKWNQGYVGSSANTQGYKNILNPTGSGYLYTDIFTVEKAGTTVFFSCSTAPSANAYVFSQWKEVNGEWVIDALKPQYSGGDTIITSQGTGFVTYRYTTSEDNEHLRICHGGSTVKQGAVVYTENTGAMGTSAAYIAKLGEKTNTNLSGKTINFVGDSYFAGNGLGTNQVWCIQLALKYGMPYENYGINGAMTSTNGGHDSMVNRIDSLPDNNPDIVIFEGGKNDFNQSTPIGTIDSTDTNTFMGALNVAITKLKAKYPNATLMGVTVWNFSGSKSVGGKNLTCNDYADAMIAVCQKYGIACFDARNKDLSGVDMTSVPFRSTYCMTPTDVSHMNYKGHLMFLPKIEAFIASNYKK